MKIVTPRIYLVGIQKVVEDGIGHFLEDHDVSQWSTDTVVAGEKLVEVAGRVCYMSFGKPRPGGNKAYIGHILEVGHGSVLEHAVYNFIFTGVSRSFTHELVRHRAGWGYSQLSQRYVDESVAEFVCPEAIERNPAALETWKVSCKQSHESYLTLVQQLLEEEPCPACKGPLQSVTDSCWNCEHKLTQEERTAVRKNVRQAARSVLPNATETKIFVTVNGRALRHFLELRGAKAAEPEIRNVAHTLWGVLKEQAPNIFGDYSLENGELHTESPKV